MSVPEGATLSEDGLWWWDGADWQSVGADGGGGAYSSDSGALPADDVSYDQGSEASYYQGSEASYDPGSQASYDPGATEVDSTDTAPAAGVGTDESEDHEVETFVLFHGAGHVVGHLIHIGGIPATLAVTLIELVAHGIKESAEYDEELQRQQYELATESARAGLVAAQYVAGCDGDHNGTSWSGPYRDTVEEATDDMNQHLYEWPDHTTDTDTETGEAGVQEY